LESVSHGDRGAGVSRVLAGEEEGHRSALRRSLRGSLLAANEDESCGKNGSVSHATPPRGAILVPGRGSHNGLWLVGAQKPIHNRTQGGWCQRNARRDRAAAAARGPTLQRVWSIRAGAVERSVFR
jgi:hypothetical protein